MRKFTTRLVLVSSLASALFSVGCSNEPMLCPDGSYTSVEVPAGKSKKVWVDNPTNKTVIVRAPRPTLTLRPSLPSSPARDQPAKERTACAVRSLSLFLSYTLRPRMIMTTEQPPVDTSEPGTDVPPPAPTFAWIPVDTGPLPPYSRYPADVRSQHAIVRHRIENDIVLIRCHHTDRDDEPFVTVGVFGMIYNRLMAPEDKFWDFVEDLTFPEMRSRFVTDAGRGSGYVVTHWSPMPDEPGDTPDSRWRIVKDPATGERTLPGANELVIVRHTVGGGDIYYHTCKTVGRCWKHHGPDGPVRQWGVLHEFWTQPTWVTRVTHWMPLPTPQVYEAVSDY